MGANVNGDGGLVKGRLTGKSVGSLSVYEVYRFLSENLLDEKIPGAEPPDSGPKRGFVIGVKPTNSCSADHDKFAYV
jgi:hypothetical protein